MTPLNFNYEITYRILTQSPIIKVATSLNVVFRLLYLPPAFKGPLLLLLLHAITPSTGLLGSAGLDALLEALLTTLLLLPEEFSCTPEEGC